MKKIKLFIVSLLAILFVSGCGAAVTNIEGNLEDLMAKVYEGISETDLPAMITNIPLDSENQVAYIGEANINYKEAIASESAIGSVAHSIVLIRMNDDATSKEIEDAKKELKEKVNPRKWLCVGVEEIHVENIGNLIIVILNDQHAETFKTNFKNLK